MSLIDSIIGAESGGNPNAKNPNSTATGLGQFIASTWIDTLSRERPDLVAGKSKDEILALRTNPELSRQMTEAYAAQNGQTLARAGFEANPANTYLAHFAGPQGAISVLGANPATPVSALLPPAAVAANPFLRDMSAGDLQAWAARKMGAGGPLKATAPAPMQAQVQPSTQATPIFAAPTQEPPPQQAAPESPVNVEQPLALNPIFASRRKPIEMSRLKAAMASGNRGLSIFGRG